MRRILLLLVGLVILAVPAAAAARQQGHHAAPGFLVVRGAFSDGGVKGAPVATIAVHGFVIGHIAQEGAVKIFHFNSGGGSVAQVSGVGVVTSQKVTYYGRGGSQGGTKFSGSDFRFRAVGGFWRVVVYGAGVSLYAGGEGIAHLHGSHFSPATDGRYSFDGARFASLPAGIVTQTLGHR
jgi:hypothetical protein